MSNLKVGEIAGWLWDDHREALAIAGFLALLIGICAFAIHAAVEEERQWNRFAAEHHCQKVGEISPTTTTGVGISADGKPIIVTTTEAGKTGYKCDDGVTYWR